MGESLEVDEWSVSEKGKKKTVMDSRPIDTRERSGIYK